MSCSKTAKAADPYKNYRRLLSRWDGICVLCGEPFDNLESLTREHIVPRSNNGNGTENLAPSHFRCNQARGNLSLIEAMVLLRAKKKHLGEKFAAWCNMPVPNRFDTEKNQAKKSAKKLADEKSNQERRRHNLEEIGAVCNEQSA